MAFVSAYRIAVVTGPNTNERQIEQYLPGNYTVVGTMPDENGSVIIAGIDDAGWTLEDYVIPRLMSGMYSCTELTEAVRV
jgi:hypothetical protein